MAQTLITFSLLLATLAQSSTWSQRNMNGPLGRMDSVLTGTWGGEHMRLEVSSKGARIEYDCAPGTIDQPMTLDRSGYFDVRGVHVTERGGPVREGGRSDRLAARYTGVIEDQTIPLPATLPDSKAVA